MFDLGGKILNKEYLCCMEKGYKESSELEESSESSSADSGEIPKLTLKPLTSIAAGSRQSSMSTSSSRERDKSSGHSPTKVLALLRSMKKVPMTLPPFFNEERDDIWRKKCCLVSHHGILHLKSLEKITSIYSEWIKKSAQYLLENREGIGLFFQSQWPQLIYLLLRTDSAGKINSWDLKPFEEEFHHRFDIRDMAEQKQLAIFIIALMQELKILKTETEFKIIFRSPNPASIIAEKILNPTFRATKNSRKKTQSKEKKEQGPIHGICSRILTACKKFKGWPNSCDYTKPGITPKESIEKKANYQKLIEKIISTIHDANVEQAQKVMTIYYYLLLDISMKHKETIFMDNDEAIQSFVDNTMDYIFWYCLVLSELQANIINIDDEAELRVLKLIISHFQFPANNTLSSETIEENFPDESDISRTVTPQLKQVFRTLQSKLVNPELIITVESLGGKNLHILPEELKIDTEVFELQKEDEKPSTLTRSGRLTHPKLRQSSTSVLSIQWPKEGDKETKNVGEPPKTCEL